MCLIVVGWQAHPDYPLVLAANRDEFFFRASAPAAFWPEAPGVLAGRDLQAGGSWLGVDRRGRFSALTNYREGGQPLPLAPSRGALVADYLTRETGSGAYLGGLAERGAAFNGFNLLVGDAQRLGYYANRGAGPCWLSPGIYGLSNHLLDTPWPKLAAAKATFAEALRGLAASGVPDLAPFFTLLADREIVLDTHLPETGVSLEWERILSAIFVRSPDYGTRASTVLTIDRSGGVRFVERSFGADGLPLGEVRESFQSFQSSPISTGV